MRTGLQQMARLLRYLGRRLSGFVRPLQSNERPRSDRRSNATETTILAMVAHFSRTMYLIAVDVQFRMVHLRLQDFSTRSRLRRGAQRRLVPSRTRYWFRHRRHYIRKRVHSFAWNVCLLITIFGRFNTKLVSTTTDIHLTIARARLLFLTIEERMV